MTTERRSKERREYDFCTAKQRFDKNDHSGDDRKADRRTPHSSGAARNVAPPGQMPPNRTMGQPPATYVAPDFDGSMELTAAPVPTATGEARFAEWWNRTGRFYDPDTDEVPWFDKRKFLAEQAFIAALASAPTPGQQVTAAEAREWLHAREIAKGEREKKYISQWDWPSGVDKCSELHDLLAEFANRHPPAPAEPRKEK